MNPTSTDPATNRFVAHVVDCRTCLTASADSLLCAQGSMLKRVARRTLQFVHNDPQAIAYALQGEHLNLRRIESGAQRDRVARQIRQNDLRALRYAFPSH